MANEEIETRLREALPQLGRLNAAVRFDLGSDGCYFVDARSNPATLSEDDEADADCTIKIKPENLLKLMDGKLDPMLGYTLGKIKISGSMGVAMKLVNAIG